MKEFLVSYWRELLYALIAVCVFIISFVRTGSIKKSVVDIEKIFYYLEDNQLKKHRTFNSSTSGFKQSFTPEVDDYILDPVTNELEKKPIPKNVQAYIDSYLECALDRTLERFLPKVVEEKNDTYADYTNRCDDLAALGEAMELAEKYRDQFRLPDNATMATIFATVDKSAKELKEKLIASKEVKKDEEIK